MGHPVFCIRKGLVLLFGTISIFERLLREGIALEFMGSVHRSIGGFSSDPNAFGCKARSHEGKATAGAKPCSAGPMMGKRQRVKTPMAMASHIRSQNNGSGSPLSREFSRRAS